MTNSKNSSNNSSESNELYAIAETSGQQFWFEVGRFYDIDRLNAKEKVSKKDNPIIKVLLLEEIFWTISEELDGLCTEK